MFYTGIGSRETPYPVLDTMYSFGIYMAQHGAVLRSGGANGADSAFESGAIRGAGEMEIYLPWNSFNGRSSHFTRPSDDAFSMASEIHPAWQQCSRGAKKLHARNCHQILGMDLNTPSSFVVCWTPGGKLTGGTRTAIVLAHMNHIPVFNLFNHNLDMIVKWLNSSTV